MSNDSSGIPAATGVISSRVWRESVSVNIPQRSRLICVEPHQRINFTVVDFSVDEPAAPTTHMQVARQSVSSTAAACSDPLVVVNEVDDEDDVESGSVICGGQTRLASVYLSTSSCVRILLNATAARKSEFLIRYEGIEHLSISLVI